MALEMEKNLSSVKVIVETVTSRLGYATLKKEQKDAILSFVVGRDVFVVLPTGYGSYTGYPVLHQVPQFKTAAYFLI